VRGGTSLLAMTAHLSGVCPCGGSLIQARRHFCSLSALDRKTNLKKQAELCRTGDLAVKKYSRKLRDAEDAVVRMQPGS
jgi:hypothetical protein